jgi:hypothetical protein
MAVVMCASLLALSMMIDTLRTIKSVCGSFCVLCAWFAFQLACLPVWFVVCGLAVQAHALALVVGWLVGLVVGCLLVVGELVGWVFHQALPSLTTLVCLHNTFRIVPAAVVMNLCKAITAGSTFPSKNNNSSQTSSNEHTQTHGTPPAQTGSDPPTHHRRPPSK